MTAQSSSLLSNPAVAASLGALAGGILSFISTFYFNNRQRNVQRKRLRRALATELGGLEIMQLRIAVHTMQSRGIVQQTIGDYLFSMAEERFGEMPEGGRENAQGVIDDISQNIIQQAAPEAFEKVELYLATPIFESNTGKIGLLDSDEIEQLVKFHRFLDVTRDEVKRVIDSVNDSDNLQSRLQSLENNLEALESMRENVLNSLGEDTEELKLSEEVIAEASERNEQDAPGTEVAG